MSVRCSVLDVTPTDDAHLGGGATLRSLNDRKGRELIDGVLEIVATPDQAYQLFEQVRGN